jgi:hypothetical protein
MKVELAANLPRRGGGMRTWQTVAIACTLAIAGQVQAATYFATLEGGGLHQDEFGDELVSWTGRVTVVTDGSASGTYSGATLESISLSSNWESFGYTKGETQTEWEYAPWMFLPIGPEPGASVSILDGRLISVDLVYDDFSAYYGIAGMSAYEDSSCRTGDCHGIPDNILLSGSLSSVPEPATLALFLGGILLATARRRASLSTRKKPGAGIRTDSSGEGILNGLLRMGRQSH